MRNIFNIQETYKRKDYGYYKNKLTFINEGEKPVIKNIKFVTIDFTLWGGHEKSYKITVDILDETKEMQAQFRSIRKADLSLPLGQERIDTGSFKYIKPFIRLIQKIDPIPFDSLVTLKEIGYDMSEFICFHKIEQFVDEGKHQEALDLALEASSKKETTAIIHLKDLYAEKGDINNYYNILKHYPSDHPDLKLVNEELFSYYMSHEIPEDQNERIALLENKFRFVLNLGFKNEARNFFDELCGNNGFGEISKISFHGDPDSFIKLAKVIRDLKNENSKLKNEVPQVKEIHAAEIHVSENTSHMFNRNKNSRNSYNYENHDQHGRISEYTC